MDVDSDHFKLLDGVLRCWNYFAFAMFANCSKETSIVVSFKLYYIEVLLIIAYFEVILNMCLWKDN